MSRNRDNRVWRGEKERKKKKKKKERKKKKGNVCMKEER